MEEFIKFPYPYDDEPLPTGEFWCHGCDSYGSDYCSFCHFIDHHLV